MIILYIFTQLGSGKERKKKREEKLVKWVKMSQNNYAIHLWCSGQTALKHTQLINKPTVNIHTLIQILFSSSLCKGPKMHVYITLNYYVWHLTQNPPLCANITSRIILMLMACVCFGTWLLFQIILIKHCIN